MQSWKIKRMSYRRIHAWIVAINKLLAHYEGRISKLDECPFCSIARRYCYSCLWHIFWGDSCVEFRYKKFPNNFKLKGFFNLTDWEKARHSKRWRSLRIPMLKDWKKALKIELARRDV